MADLSKYNLKIDRKYEYLLDEHVWCVNRGYVVRNVRVNIARQATVRLHRVIYELEYGTIPDKHHIHHVNEDRLDNRIENLECLSSSEHQKRHKSTAANKAKMRETNLGNRGDKSPSSKLSDEKWLELVELYYSENYTQRELGKKYGLTENHVWHVLSGRSRKHLYSKIIQIKYKYS